MVCRVAPMGDMILTSVDGAPPVSGVCVASCTTGECPLSVSFEPPQGYGGVLRVA